MPELDTPNTTPEEQDFGAALAEIENNTSAGVDDGSPREPEQKPEETKARPDDDAKARHAENYANAQRRIERKRSRQNQDRRIKELTEELAKYRGESDPAKQAEARHIQGRLDDLQAMSDDADEDEYRSKAEQVFGDGAEDFIKESYRYGEYINAKEPELRKYIDREHGFVLLKAWYDRMNQPKTRAQWLNMTPYEKGKVLDKFYTEIIKAKSEDMQRPQQVTDAPVPGSGRDTSNHQQTGDEWADALNEVNESRRKGR